MTPSFRLRYSLCQNFSPINSMEDKLIEAQDPAIGSNSGSFSPTLSPAPSRNPTLVLAPALALVAFNDLFKQFMKTYLESS